MSAPAGPLSPRDNTRHGMRFAPGVLGAVHPVYRQVAAGSSRQWSETGERNREKGRIIDRKTAGANNITTVVKMPIADSTRDIRYMSPQADSRRMAWSRKQRGAGEIDLSARWRSGGKPTASPTRKSQRAQLRVLSPSL
ncbi:hypothetical protein ALC57_01864 [Trachymyrmex cornetzi]|uniref:Uncharacterized protein n=1 Tax=Trachymyrmex cornetzi TaxID=471704 RepID=A0A195EKV3_9HYME|nr:hypothetical protein ALC57_01864 [Trachymyrmex cornetzi]